MDTDGRLKFLPVEQLQTLRREHYEMEHVLVEEGQSILPKEMNGDSLEIKVNSKVLRFDRQSDRKDPDPAVFIYAKKALLNFTQNHLHGFCIDLA